MTHFWPIFGPFLTPFLALFFHFFCSLTLFLALIRHVPFLFFFFEVILFSCVFRHFLSFFITFFNFTLDNTLEMTFYRFLYVPQKWSFFDVFLTFFDVFWPQKWPFLTHFLSFFNNKRIFFLFLRYFCLALKVFFFVHFLHVFCTMSFFRPQKWPFFSLFFTFFALFDHLFAIFALFLGENPQ